LDYSRFETDLLIALLKAADADQNGDAEAYAVAETVLPKVAEQWVISALQTYESQGAIYDVRRGATRRLTFLKIAGTGRRIVEAIEAERTRAEQPRQKIGY